MKQHQKHPAIARPVYGNFHRQEWSIIGTPCTVIEQLSATLIAALSDRYRLGYVDADHAAADTDEPLQPVGAWCAYTDRGSYHRLDFRDEATPFQQRQWLQASDAVLVNGNHFSARQQIVVLDTRKKESLSRKLDRLDNVVLVLAQDATLADYDFLRTHLGDTLPPILPITDTAAIVAWMAREIAAATPPLYGLVLAGGQSSRMGENKALLDYHGMAQFEWVAQLLRPHCAHTYISLRDELQLPTALPVIVDSFQGLGVYGAILSAFRTVPDAAWLTVACDLPLLDEAALAHLVAARDTSKLATAFHNPATGWPDPLVTIWEPRAYPQLLQFLSMGYTCPRKVLINSDIQSVPVPHEHTLRNANDPQERAALLALLAANGGA